MKILIISTYFPPLNAVASIRPYSWAKYWSQAGHEVVVLTTPKPPNPSNTDYPAEGFRVIAVPIPFFGILQGALGEKQREALAVPAKGRPWRLALSRLAGVVMGCVGWLQKKYGVLNTCRFPDLTDLWVRPAFRAVAAERWDIVVSTAWPYTVHRVASKLHRKGIAKKWIADWRDLWVENHLFPGIWPFTLLEKRWEQSWIYRADGVTAVSEPQATLLGNKYSREVIAIYNGFDPDDYAQLPAEPAFPSDEVFRIVFTGSYYPGRQNPEPFFKALYQLHRSGKIRPDTLQVLFYGYNSDLTSIAEQHQVGDYVEYRGFLPRPQALHAQRDADALLFLDFASDSVPGILSGKLFEYLYAGPPIVSVGLSLDGSVSAILEKTARGKAFGEDMETLAEEILALLHLKKRSSAPAEEKTASPLPIHLYSRQSQARQLLALAVGVSPLPERKSLQISLLTIRTPP